MNEELKLILYSFRQKMKFRNGNADNLCRRMKLNMGWEVFPLCKEISCFNCILTKDYEYPERIIHVWNQL